MHLIWMDNFSADNLKQQNKCSINKSEKLIFLQLLFFHRCLQQDMEQVVDQEWEGQSLCPIPHSWSPSNMSSSKSWPSTQEGSTAWPCPLRARCILGEREKMENQVMEIEGMKKKPIFNLNYTHIFVHNICNLFGFKKQIFIFVAFLMEVKSL